MILKAIKNRRSIRDYRGDSVPENYLLDVLKAAAFAPNSHHNRSIELIVIKDQKIKNSLYSLLGQGYLKQAPVLIAPVVNVKKSTSPIQDLSVASENIFIQASSLGLGTAWKNIEPHQISEVKKILCIPKNFLIINLIPLGYPKTKRRPHIDKDFDLRKTHYDFFNRRF